MVYLGHSKNLVLRMIFLFFSLLAVCPNKLTSKTPLYFRYKVIFKKNKIYKNETHFLAYAMSNLYGVRNLQSSFSGLISVNCIFDAMLT